ncbi:MAG: hypothetical protein U0930_11635 [Pirellulales bacterium]
MNRRTIAIGLIAAIFGSGVFYWHGVQNTPVFQNALPDTALIDQSFVGSYYCGDGLGFNQVLDLNTDGTFNCSWHGCLGDYGSTTGIWGRKEQHVYLATRTASGMFETSPLSDLGIVTKNEQRYLLPKEFEDTIKKHGDEMIPVFSFALRTTKK